MTMAPYYGAPRNATEELGCPTPKQIRVKLKQGAAHL